jgi:predicted Fe-Mo cluster-binding NifX family protein
MCMAPATRSRRSTAGVWMPMVVGGIGAGALSKLNAMGIKVYSSAAATVKENLSLLNESKLQELFSIHACRGHEGGCGH